jgi:hypothetical protein
MKENLMSRMYTLDDGKEEYIPNIEEKYKHRGENRKSEHSDLENSAECRRLSYIYIYIYIYIYTIYFNTEKSAFCPHNVFTVSCDSQYNDYFLKQH